MAELRIMQTMPHNSPGTNLQMPKILVKFQWDAPSRGHT